LRFNPLVRTLGPDFPARPGGKKKDMNWISKFILVACAVLAIAGFANAQLITSVPGPDDQGGMLMPMVTITNYDNINDPTRGNISIVFNNSHVPLLQGLQQWSPASWFSQDAAWRQDLGSPAGTAGTPVENAGQGDLFNNQYGFMFMSMGTGKIPIGKSLAIRLNDWSSPFLESYNYSSGSNRWDRVFTEEGSQVLWNGSMWHNFFTLPSDAPAGTYSATFEIFIANTPFTGSTGFAQYNSAALSAQADPNFNSASLTYTWTVIPEPSLMHLLGLSCVLAVFIRFQARQRTSADPTS
jgi:hypothetical protein